MAGADDPDLGPDFPDLPDPQLAASARRLRGCLPAALVAVVVIVAAVFWGLDRRGSDDSEPSDAAGPTTAPASAVEEPTTASEPDPTDAPLDDPTAPATFEQGRMTGTFQTVAGKPVANVFRNEILVDVTPLGMVGAMTLVIDSTLDFDEEEPVCYFIDVDLDAKPLPVRVAPDGNLVAEGPVTLVAGFADGRCGGSPERTDARPGSATVVIETDGSAVGEVRTQAAVLTFELVADAD